MRVSIACFVAIIFLLFVTSCCVAKKDDNIQHHHHHHHHAKEKYKIQIVYGDAAVKQCAGNFGSPKVLPNADLTKVYMFSACCAENACVKKKYNAGNDKAILNKIIIKLSLENLKCCKK